MRSLVQLRWYKFGNAYLWQKAGIPIGGPVSGAVLEAVLSVGEHIFDKFKWPTIAEQLGLKGERMNWIALARYVDDVLASSRWLCQGCIEKLIKTIYSQTISFDRACGELTNVNKFAAVKFLDLWIYLSCHIFSVSSTAMICSLSPALLR